MDTEPDTELEITEEIQKILDDYLPVFVHGYCRAMLWANTTIEGVEPGEVDVDPAWWQAPGLWGIEAFAPEDREDIRNVCERFVHLTFAWLMDPKVQERGWESAGIDFALTRNGHGAGFWDRGYGEVGEHLSKWARTFGSSSAWIHDPGDDDTDNFAHLESHDE